MGKISLEYKERTVNEKNGFRNMGEMIRWESMSTRLN